MASQFSIDLACDLGPAAFHDMNWWAARTALTIITNDPLNDSISTLDASNGKGPEVKSTGITRLPLRLTARIAFQKFPDTRIAFAETGDGALLSSFAFAPNGMHGGDSFRYRQCFWEHVFPNARWVPFQMTVSSSCEFGGRESVFDWKDDGKDHQENPQARVQGNDAWKRNGVVVSMMQSLPVTRYTGERFDISCTPIIPINDEHFPAIWAFCSSPEYSIAIRKIDSKVNVTNGTLVKVPFDLAHWQQVAAEKYPNGLPEPYSDDPTQWLFHGHPRHADPGTELHVALARLAGYRWPAETDATMRLSAEARARIAEAATLPEADNDGLLALVPVLGERPLADRLRAFCAAAWGDSWLPGTEAALITAACDRAKEKPPRQLTLDAWLRTHAARQHAKLFHDRPMLWFITDARADGFTAVIHYHRLTRTNLERLAWTILGDWLARLGDDPRAEAARVLQAKLAAILEGEKPYDIFVRWKPLEKQPLGWDPDLDDGVRLNIRPFIEAGVLAHAPNVKYATDRGKDVDSAPWFKVFKGERRNNHHTTLAEKRAARTAT